MNTTGSGAVRFDADLIARYDGRGPRYTSYPTAPQFTSQFTANDYRRFAAHSNATDGPLSLYVHIPFCQSLCYYCGCNKIVTRNQERVSRYLGHLHREIDMQAELFGKSRRVEQLHFGGGTPTYLAEDVQLVLKLDSRVVQQEPEGLAPSPQVPVGQHRARHLGSGSWPEDLGAQDNALVLVGYLCR